MEDKEQVEKTVNRGGRTAPRRKRYTYEEKLRAVKLHLEEGFNAVLVCQETGVSPSSLGGWLARYRKDGEMGLRRGWGGPPGAGEGEDRGDEARKPLLWGEADRRRPASVVFPRGEPGDGQEDAPRGGPHERAGEGPPQPGAPALL
jgi:hypothetical protein